MLNTNKKTQRSHIKTLSCLFQYSKDKTSGVGNHQLLHDERKKEYKT